MVFPTGAGRSQLAVGRGWLGGTVNGRPPTANPLLPLVERLHLRRRERVRRPEVPGQVRDHRGLILLVERCAPAHHLLDRGGPLLLGEALLDEEVRGVAGVARRLDLRAGGAGQEGLERRADEGEGEKKRELHAVTCTSAECQPL